jgi:hypothetical protein
MDPSTRGEGRPVRPERKERVRGNVLTTGVFAAVQTRQIKVNSNTDVHANEKDRGGRRDQKQPVPPSSTSSQAQSRKDIQNLSGSRSAAAPSSQSAGASDAEEKLTEKSKDIMNMKEKIALKVAKMKANAKEFNPRSTPSSSSTLNLIEQEHDNNTGMVGSVDDREIPYYYDDKERDQGREQVQTSSSTTIAQSSSMQNLQTHTYSSNGGNNGSNDSNNNVSYSLGGNQGGISPVRYTSQSQGQPVIYDMNIQMQQERLGQQQMMQQQPSQNNYIDPNIDMSYDNNNRNYNENYIENYSPQGQGITFIDIHVFMICEDNIR